MAHTTFPPGTIARIHSIPAHVVGEKRFGVVLAVPPVEATLDTYAALLTTRCGLAAMLTHDEDVCWPDMAGVTLAAEVLKRGGAVLALFITRHDANRFLKRLRQTAARRPVGRYPIRELAELSSAVSVHAPDSIRTLKDAVAVFPCRTALAPSWAAGLTAADFPPIRTALALLPDEPFTGENLAEAVALAEEALAADECFLLLATNEAQRDAVKARIVAAMDAAVSGTGGRA